MHWTRSAIVAVVGYSSLFCPYRAEGYPVTFEFAGEITYVRDDDDLLGGAVTVGSPFSGLYTFESTTPDSDPDEPKRGLYEGAIMGISGEVAGVSFGGPVGPRNSIEVRNAAFDSYAVRPDIQFAGETLDALLSVVDDSGIGLSDDSLPLSPPDLTAFESAHFSIFDASEIVPLSVHGELALLVPEPGVASMLGVAVFLMIRRRHVSMGKHNPVAQEAMV